jgi:hypothetical protein
MTIKRIVDTKFWRDENVLDKYSVEDKYFLLYLMTNPSSTQLGIYKIPKRVISFETGYTLESVEVLIERFCNKYQNILYNHSTQEVSVLNSLKYSVVKGGKPVSDLLTKELNKIDSDELIFLTYEHMKKWWLKSKRKFDKTVMLLFEQELQKRKVTKEKSNDNDNDNENEESYHDSSYESYHESSSSKRFKPPTLDEVSKYIQENGYNVNPETFIAFYESKGWKVGKNKMKSWESAVRGWHSRNKEKAQTVTEIETPWYMQEKGGLKGDYEKVD